MAACQSPKATITNLVQYVLMVWCRLAEDAFQQGHQYFTGVWQALGSCSNPLSYSCIDRHCVASTGARGTDLASTMADESTPRVRTPRAGTTGRWRTPLEAGGTAQLGSCGRMGTNTTPSQSCLLKASHRSRYLRSLPKKYISRDLSEAYFVLGQPLRKLSQMTST